MMLAVIAWGMCAIAVRVIDAIAMGIGWLDTYEEYDFWTEWLPWYALVAICVGLTLAYGRLLPGQVLREHRTRGSLILMGLFIPFLLCCRGCLFFLDFD